MKKYLIYSLVLLLFSTLSFAQELAPAITQPPIVAANTALKLVLEDINLQFSKDTGLSIKFDFQSSAVLYHKILQKPESFELFMSDDEQYVADLAKKGLTGDKSILYAIGRLILFAPKGSPLVLDSELAGLKANLKAAELSQFIIADPQNSNYGRASKQALINVGIWDEIQSRLSLAESVQQAAQVAAFGQTQGGIFAYSLVLNPWVKAQGNFVLISEKLYPTLRHRMVLLKNPSSVTKTFYQYLQQPKSQAIFEQYGLSLQHP